eukprot:scaffold354553_cov25-Prasinocladus_malaysianus.AAC.1
MGSRLRLCGHCGHYGQGKGPGKCNGNYKGTCASGKLQTLFEDFAFGIENMCACDACSKLDLESTLVGSIEERQTRGRSARWQKVLSLRRTGSSVTVPPSGYPASTRSALAASGPEQPAANKRTTADRSPVTIDSANPSSNTRIRRAPPPATVSLLEQAQSRVCASRVSICRSKPRELYTTCTESYCVLLAPTPITGR